MPRFIVEVNLSKGWEIVFETSDHDAALRKLKHEFEESSQNPDAKEDCRLTIEF